MYHERSHSGSSPDFWEETWENEQYEDAVRFCAVDPLRPLFEKYSEPGSLMLEGGCGMGQYLTYYRARGRRVIGLDFALKALNTLNGREKGLPLACGDVSSLPFADETFDLYYSGGVVEHFEGGAEASLAEACRVLKKTGTLLISVPYFSPLRRVLLPIKGSQWKKVSSATVENRSGSDNFFQYAYRMKEFTKMLSDAGLEVKETAGYAVLWGLYDIPFLTPEDASAPPSNSRTGNLDVADLANNEKPVSLLKKLVVSESRTVPVLGSVVSLMCWSSANMMMYVCGRK